MNLPSANATALEWARFYLHTGYGFHPIPVPPGEKGPRLDGWQTLRLTEEDLPRYFNGAPQNIGNVNGDIADVDIDFSALLGVADSFLPRTELRWGRRSKRSSHRGYWALPIGNTVQFKDPQADAMLVELRSINSQTILPGTSRHPDGETYDWDAFGPPAVVPWEELRDAVARLAATGLLARRFAALGSGHVFALATAGFLLRGGLDTIHVLTIITSAAKIAGKDPLKDFERAVRDTAAKISSGEPATGAGRLTESVPDGKRVVDTLRRWLQLAVIRPHRTDAGNAERFAERFGDRVRYCWLWKSWLFYEGRRWKRDADAEVMALAKESALEN